MKLVVLLNLACFLLLLTTTLNAKDNSYTIDSSSMSGPINAPKSMGNYFTEESKFDGRLYYAIEIISFYKDGKFHHDESVALIEWKLLKTGEKIEQKFLPKKGYAIYPADFDIKEDMLIITERPNKKTKKKIRLFAAYKWQGDKFGKGKFVFVKRTSQDLWNIE